LYASTAIKELLGGSKMELNTKIEKQIRDMFHMDEYENNMAEMLGTKENFAPTLKSYMTGKDQYLSFINNLIDKTEGALMKQDMGNPAVAESYNQYLTYLYTLKGRQNERYGNYLSAAIDDYDATYAKYEANYENIKDQYDKAMDRGHDMLDDEYAEKYNALATFYREVKEAPYRAAELTNLAIEQETNRLKNLEAQIGLYNAQNPSNINEDFTADHKKLVASWEDGDGGLNWNTVEAGGLAQMIDRARFGGEGLDVGMSVISQLLNQSVDNAKNDYDDIDIDKLNKVISSLETLSEDEDYGSFAPRLYQNIAPKLSEKLGMYLDSNLGTIKQFMQTAASQMEEGKNPEDMVSLYSARLKPFILYGAIEDIKEGSYSGVENNIFENKPREFVEDRFSYSNVGEDLARSILGVNN